MAPLNEIVAVPGGSEIGPAILAEAAAIASASGFTRPPAEVDTTAAAVTKPGSALTSSSSMYRDVVAGHPTESDYILGDLVTRAHAHNIEAPLLGMAAIQLRIHDIRADAAPVSRQLG